jgi:drug/metabolite transporter (DMT)-like permease
VAVTSVPPPARRRVAPFGEMVWLMVAVAATSSSAPLVRVAEAPALAIAFWRTALGFGLTGAVLAGRRRGAELREMDAPTRRRTVLAGALLAAHFATWLPSLSFTSVASSVALVCTTPVWTALIARLQGRHVAAAEWWGIAVALTGVVTLTGVDLSVSPRALFGDLLALLGGALAALYLVVGADVRQRVSTAAYTTGCYGVAAVALLVTCGIGRQPVAGFEAGTWLALAAITVGPQLLGHTLLNRVLRTVDATVVAMALLFEIVVSALLAWAFLDEVPPLSALPAGVLLIAGTLMVIRAGRSAPAEGA